MLFRWFNIMRWHQYNSGNNGLQTNPVSYVLTGQATFLSALKKGLKSSSPNTKTTLKTLTTTNQRKLSPMRCTHFKFRQLHYNSQQAIFIQYIQSEPDSLMNLYLWTPKCRTYRLENQKTEIKIENKCKYTQQNKNKCAHQTLNMQTEEP